MDGPGRPRIHDHQPRHPGAAGAARIVSGPQRRNYGKDEQGPSRALRSGHPDPLADSCGPAGIGSWFLGFLPLAWAAQRAGVETSR